MGEHVGRSMDATATTMVVLTGPEEQAERDTWARRFAERYAAAGQLGLPPSEGREAVREHYAAPVVDPRLRAAARDFRLALEVLGVDVPPPPPPGTCRRCGKTRGMHDSASGKPHCQACMRRQAGGRR